VLIISEIRIVFMKKSGTTTLDRKRIYANPSSYPNPKSNPNTNPNPQGRRQKNFQREGNGKKRPKISNNYRKIALLSLFQGRGGGQRKKDQN